MAKKRLFVHKIRVGGLDDTEAVQRRRKIQMRMITEGVGANEAKRREGLKGVYPKKKHKPKVKHTEQAFQPTEHRTERK